MLTQKLGWSATHKRQAYACKCVRWHWQEVRVWLKKSLSITRDRTVAMTHKRTAYHSHKSHEYLQCYTWAVPYIVAYCSPISATTTTHLGCIWYTRLLLQFFISQYASCDTPEFAAFLHKSHMCTDELCYHKQFCQSNQLRSVYSSPSSSVYFYYNIFS